MSKSLLGDMILAASLIISTLILTDVVRENVPKTKTPEVKILYCYKQGGDFPDVCESGISEVQ